MHRMLSCLALVTIAAPLLVSAAGAEETLRARLVSHSVASVAMDPGDGVEGHLIGSARFVGIVFYEDGRIGRTQYFANFDYVKGSGSYTTIQTTEFDDGSQLRQRNSGTAVTKDGVTTFPDGTAEITGGAGKYADATGTCTFTGMRVIPIADGGDSYFNLICDLD